MHHRRNKSDTDIGSLLRLFKSGFFDTWIAITYLYRYYDVQGVKDYLVNELFNLPDSDIEFYLFQLSNLIIQKNFKGTESLVRFILEKSTKSIHLALKLTWIFHDNPNNSNFHHIREDIETAYVNGSCPLPRTINTQLDPHARVSAGSCPSSLSNNIGTINSDMYTTQFALTKSYRNDYFTRIITFVDQLQSVSDKLRSVPVDQRQSELQGHLEILNRSLLVDGIGLYLPLTRCDESHFCIVHIVTEEAKILNSRDRVPFLLCFEILRSPENCSHPDLHQFAINQQHNILSCIDQYNKNSDNILLNHTISNNHDISTLNETMVSDYISNDNILLNHGNSKNQDLSNTSLNEIMPSDQIISDNLDVVNMSWNEIIPVNKISEQEICNNDYMRCSDIRDKITVSSSNNLKLSQNESDENLLSASLNVKFPFMPLWEDKKESIRKHSPFGKLASWDIYSVIVKYGDDLRQEQFSLQLISQFNNIFKQARLPIYLRPYSIAITSHQSGLVETLVDAASLHQIKKNTPGYTTLDNYFKTMYNYPSQQYKLAQQNFIESLVGYSIVTYFLQVKDRHNGNLMLDTQGHLIHIDFGFMLSNSPGGNLKFESAPFKLTQEFIDVIGGIDSDTFRYFKALFVKGCLECRKHYEKIISLVEMTQSSSNMPCFIGGAATIQQLKQRFNIHLPESEYIQFAEDLIMKSYYSWSTSQYDKFQYFTNGVYY